MATQKQIDICLNCTKPVCKGSCRIMTESAIEGLREQANEIKDKKERRKFWLSHGICPECKQRKVTSGYSSCAVCRKKHAEKSYRLYYEHKS